MDWQFSKLLYQPLSYSRITVEKCIERGHTVTFQWIQLIEHGTRTSLSEIQHANLWVTEYPAYCIYLIKYCGIYYISSVPDAAFILGYIFFALEFYSTQLAKRCAVMWSFCSFGTSKSHLFSTHFHLENLLVKTELLILHISSLSLRIWWRFFNFCFWLLDTREIMGRWINLLCLHDYGLFCIQWILMVNWLHLV